MKIGGLNVDYQRSQRGSGRAIELTELGREKADNYEATGPKLQILRALDRHGAMTKEALAQGLRLSVESVNEIVEEFTTLQWVKERR